MENQRPETPADFPRHLLNGDDYSNRPTSSYKMKNVVGQIIDEFNQEVNNSSMISRTTNSSLG